MNNDRIRNVYARQILDSRGNPTLSVTIELNSGLKASACVPSGASCGKYEAKELRDNDKEAYMGRGVLGAVLNVNDKISKVLIGKSVIQQKKLDELLIDADDTDKKERLGANAILGASLCIARAASKYLNLPLYKYIGGIFASIMPTPMINILNGGAHADNELDFQEFMIAPIGANNFQEAVKMASEVFYSLKNILKEKKLSTLIGDEGGFAPNIKTTREALDLIIEAINRANYSTDEIKICLDIASGEFFKDDKYKIGSENLELTSAEMCNYIKNLVEDYPIISVEDGMSESDYEGWRKLTDLLKNKVLLVGDDLFATNTKLLSEGIKNNLANAIIIKPNQIGTLTETFDAIKMAKLANYKTIISHRSGETEDTFISDLAVGVNSGLIKIGSMSRGERISKYNRLLEIECELNSEFRACKGSYAKYLGANSFNNEFLEENKCNICSRRN